ncbi:hypothetical protein, partial [Salmonella enterica]|uniref:hypothetical protein n=1 Tax=Salmonella enterica TaxID=28901 RepID=UPI0013A55CDB
MVACYGHWPEAATGRQSGQGMMRVTPESLQGAIPAFSIASQVASRRNRSFLAFDERAVRPLSSLPRCCGIGGRAGIFLWASPLPIAWQPVTSARPG